MADKDPFRAANGNWFTRGLFYETTLSDKSSVVYTLKDQDHLGYPSLPRLYVELSDPTEYHFALKYLGGWAHWEELLGNKWFDEHISRWRRELEVKLRAEALVKIRETAKGSTRDAFAANKFLLDGKWVPKEQKRGRPSKDEVSAEANRLAEIKNQIEEDHERLFN